uniref:Cytochrome c oxidase subunit 2 n=1 Tax=Trachymyrmex turrifex TaxID=460682 RepID=A0A2U8U4A6_9HYME|nr:cytochrome oxidase subunit II [Trachymyrmex turrifex]AWM96335.1 cytochrome oxidase subunit II [Trachymyrmex turrifex]AWM96337.1 cytochrome oxidase subunit II [Trachymyrmex turrifex]AWM96339.1 cytochrome oxidase subunit II [Trachymyrmex turrifex]AWM96341.1 cytochrome oxidase subunit II [Trachymyrmex turrifex]
MIFFHDTTMVVLVFITALIFFVMLTFVYNKLINRYLLENQTIEIVWTVVPMFILVFIAIPSIKILYIVDEVANMNLTVKAVGHQWYWSYEYSDFKNIEFDSFMIPTDQLELGGFRFLDVDNRCVLPFNYPVRMLTTSMDVIHAWTVPSLGIKMDSTPGRLNQAQVWLSRPGVYFGQCSEICGINHSFMPISVEATNMINFKKWLINF